MNHADSDRLIVYDLECSFGIKRSINEDELEQDLINVQHHIRLMAAASSTFKICLCQSRCVDMNKAQGILIIAESLMPPMTRLDSIVFDSRGLIIVNPLSFILGRQACWSCSCK